MPAIDGLEGRLRVAINKALPKVVAAAVIKKLRSGIADSERSTALRKGEPLHLRFIRSFWQKLFLQLFTKCGVKPPRVAKEGKRADSRILEAGVVIDKRVCSNGGILCAGRVEQKRHRSNGCI